MSRVGDTSSSNKCVNTRHTGGTLTPLLDRALWGAQERLVRMSAAASLDDCFVNFVIDPDAQWVLVPLDQVMTASTVSVINFTLMLQHRSVLCDPWEVAPLEVEEGTRYYVQPIGE